MREVDVVEVKQLISKIYQMSRQNVMSDSKVTLVEKPCVYLLARLQESSSLENNSLLLPRWLQRLLSADG